MTKKENERNSEENTDKNENTTDSKSKGSNGFSPDEVKEGLSLDLLIDRSEEILAGRTALRRRGIIVLLLCTGLALVPVMEMFIVPLMLAASFAVLFYPIYKKILKLTGDRENLSSIICCVLLLVLLLIPTYFLFYLVGVQGVEFYDIAKPEVMKFVKEYNSESFKFITENKYVKTILSEFDWKSAVESAVQKIGEMMRIIIQSTSQGIFEFLIKMFMVMFIMFYFFTDGKKILQKIQYLSPLKEKYDELLFKRFTMMSRATIKGTIIIGFAQGTAGAITVLICGIDSWLLWGFVMIVLSIIPLVGAGLILVPTAVIQFLSGNIWQGVFILIMYIVVISNIENILRPKVVGRDAKMHDLLIFFSTLGGIAVFGVVGFIIGPVIAALFITTLEIYGLEFKKELTENPYSNITKDNPL